MRILPNGGVCANGWFPSGRRDPGFTLILSGNTFGRDQVGWLYSPATVRSGELLPKVLRNSSGSY